MISTKDLIIRSKVMEKLVSIVLPVYNGEKYLSESIESVLNQTYRNIELIIVNDCSTDSTEEIILSYQQKDSRIVYIKNDVNSKLPKSLNNGFRIAKGKYYTWTSDDNLYHSNAIETMVTYLEKHIDVGMVCCDYNVIDENDKYKSNVIVGNTNELIYRNIVGACFLYRSDIAKEIGEYRTDLFLAEDYEYWLRINLDYNIMPIHVSLYDYRSHGGSLSATRKKDVWSVTGKLLWEYLDKYEQKGSLTENELIEYFTYLLQYKQNKNERIKIELSFAFRHKKYFIKLFERLMRKLS